MCYDGTVAKVLFVSTSTTVGGAEKTLYTLATQFDQRRFQVAGVVSLKAEGEYARRLSGHGIPVTTLGVTSLPGPGAARKLRELIERERPDIVHAFMYQAIQLARLVKGRSRVPFKLISSPRVNYRSRSWFSLLVDRVLRSRDDLLIAECETSRQFLLTNLGYDPKKVSAILNGIDPDVSTTHKIDRQKKRLEMGLESGDILVGAVGRLDAQKGFATLIEAMKSLKDMSLHCAIIGDGPQRQYLDDLIREWGLEKKVRLFGEQTAVASWLPAFDIYCLPSLWEGLPNALLEALACGLPVVASAVDGVPEAITHDRDGLLAPPSSPAALGAALRALAGDSERRIRLGTAAKITVAQRFAKVRMVREYESAYDGALSR